MKTEKKYDSSNNVVETIITEEDLSSVELKTTAKGEITPVVKVYDKYPEIASAKAVEIMRKLLKEKYE